MAQGTTAPVPDSFAFGENWSRFLAVVDAERVAQSERALAGLLGVTSLAGRTFLDVGSGSGLSTVAALRLGARVRAFDVDALCVACTRELARRWAPSSAELEVGHGSILDDAFVASLGTFDVVHSWGVLHHTGAMERAMDAACRLVAPGGTLALALYNDEGPRSRRWAAVKRLHQRLPRALRAPYVAAFMLLFEAKYMAAAVVRGRLRRHLHELTHYESNRGMSWWHDWRDWIGGWPYEVATPERVIAFCAARGLDVTLRRDCGGRGCNELVFTRRRA